MVSGLLMELEDHNCWTIAEAAGHRESHRLQHFLSRAVWEDQRVLGIASAWAVSHLDDGGAVLIVDETADEKSSTDAVGYDIHRAQAMGRCEPTTGIRPFTALADQVMQAEPYASARQAFWVAGNGASHRNWVGYLAARDHQCRHHQQDRVMQTWTAWTVVSRSRLMSLIMTFMFEPAKLQMN